MLLIIGPKLFLCTGLAAQTAQKQKSRTTKSPLMQKWVFTLGFGIPFTFHRYVLDAIYQNWMSPSNDDGEDKEESLRQYIFGTPTVDQISLFLRSIANSIDTFQRYEQ